ncbi:MAG TPA: ferritin-like domain-containing protein [Rubricoccaceae bacterium]|jgi:hypothetical protein
MNTTPTPADLHADLIAETAERAAYSRRDAVKRAGLFGAAIAASPFALAAVAEKAYGQALPAAIRETLELALTLEFLERDFYSGALASNVIPASERDVFEGILQHERDHIAFIQPLLGLTGEGGRPPQGFDFTAGGRFNPFGDYQQFLILSEGFTNTGVRAYKGGAPNLMANDTILQGALTIHSVEARHASIVRRIRGQKGWIPTGKTTAPPNTIQAVFGPGTPATMFPDESNTTQGGLNLSSTLSGFSADQLVEAFDEPLDRATVLSIAAPFIVGDNP